MDTRVQLGRGLPNFRLINGAKHMTPKHNPRGTRRITKLKWNEIMSIKSATILATAVAFAASLPFAASAEQGGVNSTKTGLNGIEAAADRILDHYGFDNVDPTTLELSALVEIIDVERNDDERAGSTRGGIQAALNR